MVGADEMKRYEREKLEFDRKMAYWYGLVTGLFIGFVIGRIV